MLTMHVPINVKSPNNISEWQMGFNSAFKGLKGIKEKCSDGRNCKTVIVVNQLKTMLTDY
jgi:hypothetical protein